MDRKELSLELLRLESQFLNNWNKIHRSVDEVKSSNDEDFQMSMFGLMSQFTSACDIARKLLQPPPPKTFGD